MALNHDFVGRTHAPDEVYEVSREKIRDYAVATGDTHPVYLDPEAARALGHPDVIAPPSFAVMLFFRFGGWPLYDPEFGKRKEPVCVHRAQRVEHQRPIRPGDRLVQSTTVDDMSVMGEHEQWVMTHRISTVDGEHVCTVVNTILSRGTAALPRQTPTTPAPELQPQEV
ncbi:MaoC family dehydratase N-terminal domain-containing protein [Streptomyces pseudovenezuelae]|uniref:FAS1-like dehydratase domain-containing protein n=1 Tax=Streptomyces pseudovenezuelae TaxID=67350 RepID=UPI0034A3A1F9